MGFERARAHHKSLGGPTEEQYGSGNASFVSDAVNLEGRAQATLSVSTSAAQTSTVLAAGVYDVWCDVEVFIKTAATADDVTTDTGYVIKAGSVIPVAVSGTTKLGAIVASGTGTLRYHRVR